MSTNVLTGIISPKRKIATQVRNTHILILALTFLLVVAMTAIVVTGITNDISENIVRFYSVEAMEKFNYYIQQDLVLVQKVSRSAAVSNWFADEENPIKRAAAYDEMMDYTGTLPNALLHFAIDKSKNEFSIDGSVPFEDFVHFDTLSPSYAGTNWYSNTIESENNYILNVDIDKITKKPRLWINHKVTKDGKIVGVFCSGIPFDELVRGLFANYDNKNVRGYIVDKDGYIQMDSTSSVAHLENNIQNSIFSLCADTTFNSVLADYLAGIADYFDPDAETVIIKLVKDSNKYASILPIEGTSWSVVTFFNSHSLYSIKNLTLLLAAILIAFVICTLSGSLFIYRLVLTPLNLLTKSLSASKFYSGEIYGCNRDDEIGDLALTIQKMRDRLSTYNAELLRAARERERLIRIDQLTDIPNRRSFDERLPLEWGRSIRTGTPISLLILDLDHFKNYNDTYGHLQGDKALQAVAKLFMLELKRSGDLVA
ncbi:MAG: GGDEF domain-containing protein, partial [Treponema sp.]|nr:GGDEF domain-containing protein [Treponema sp.]